MVFFVVESFPLEKDLDIILTLKSIDKYHWERPMFCECFLLALEPWLEDVNGDDPPCR